MKKPIESVEDLKLKKKAMDDKADKEEERLLEIGIAKSKREEPEARKFYKEEAKRRLKRHKATRAYRDKKLEKILDQMDANSNVNRKEKMQGLREFDEFIRGMKKTYKGDPEGLEGGFDNIPIGPAKRK